MFHEDDLRWFNHYFSSRGYMCKAFHAQYIKNLGQFYDEEEIIFKRNNYLDLLVLKLNSIPKDIAEMTFNLFHVCFKLEDELKKKFMMLTESKDDFNRHDFNLEVFCENSFQYLFYTCLFVVTKLCSSSLYHTKIKEMIIDMNLNYNIILLCEVLLLNYIDWKLFLFSPTDMIFTILHFLNLPKNVLPHVQENIENYINYVLSEFSIYSAFDLSVICVAICKLALVSVNKDSNPYLGKLDYLISDFLQVEQVSQCMELIENFLCESDDDSNSHTETETSSPLIF